MKRYRKYQLEIPIHIYCEMPESGQDEFERPKNVRKLVCDLLGIPINTEKRSVTHTIERNHSNRASVDTNALAELDMNYSVLARMGTVVFEDGKEKHVKLVHGKWVVIKTYLDGEPLEPLEPDNANH